MEQNNAPKPVATFIGYLEGISPSIEWLGDEMPVGTQFYAMPTPVLDRAPVIESIPHVKMQGNAEHSEFLESYKGSVNSAPVIAEQAAGSVEAERARFEEWLSDHGYPVNDFELSRDSDGRYRDQDYMYMWVSWEGRAALDTRAQPVGSDELTPVINWLEGGCDPINAARELRLLQKKWDSRAQPVAGDAEADFTKWMEKRGALGAGAVPERIFFAGHAAGRRAARSAVPAQASAAEGFLVVPEVPTPAMQNAAKEYADKCAGYMVKASATGYYRAMLAVAPVPAQVEPGARHRVFTYKDQPGNVEAWRFGEAASNTSRKPGGDYIDTGLQLLLELQNKGYGIVAVEPAAHTQAQQEGEKK